MKTLYSTFALTSLFVFFLLLPGQSKACDRSEISLDSVVAAPGFTDVHITMHVGGGISGTSKGAGGDTQTFAFLFYGDPTMTAISFTPALTSDSTKATYNGVNVGPAFGSQFAIGYLYNGIPYTCISTTSACGREHTDSKQVTFRLNELPDSLRLVGIEGAGNPFAGCYPDADMMLSFTLFPVVWADVEAIPEPEGVAVKWSTVSESNNDYFEIERSTNGKTFSSLDRISATGNATSLSSYSYSDQNAPAGRNFYRISQTDIDGKTSSSEVVQVEVTATETLDWIGVSPNPFRGELQIRFSAPKSGNAILRLTDMQGQVALEINKEVHPGQNRADLSCNNLGSGIYFAEIETSGQKIMKRLVKL
jgi:hypothetical protein